VSCVDKNKSPLIKNAQKCGTGTWFVLWFELVKILFAIQQIIEFFVRKRREFFNSVQIAVK
jgi:hypothetical protein